MATPILDRVSKDLAYKLQDPVALGTANGARISAAERFRYILRGYRRLVRVVATLYPQLINRIFAKYYTVLPVNTNSAGLYTLNVDAIEVYETLAKEPAQETYVRATYIEPQDWVSIIGEVNNFYVPDLNTRTYYWTMLQDYVNVAPPTTYNLRISVRLDYPAKMESSGQGGIYDLDLYTEYLDLVLAAAAAEAYLDIGQPDLANANMNDFTSQLQLLAARMQKMEVKNEH